jgi:hypothetical protein
MLGARPGSIGAALDKPLISSFQDMPSLVENQLLIIDIGLSAQQVDRIWRVDM